MPIPLAAIQMGLGLAGAGAQYFGQKKMLKGQQQRAGAALERERAASAKARASMEGTNYDVAQSYRTMLDQSSQDPVADALRAQNQRREATTVDALKSGGARALLGGLGAANQQSADQMASIEADSFGRQQNALKTFGAQEQRAQDANTEKQLGMYEFDYGRALGRGDEAETTLADSRMQQQQLNTDMLSGGLGMLGQTLGSGLMGNSAQVGFGGGGGNGFLGNLFRRGANNSEMASNLFDPNSTDPLLTGEGGMGTLGAGGIYGAGGGMITPGKFSHETNPIHMVRKGEKVGELTGDEVVLNPQQEKKVASESPYFKALLKKFKADAKKRKK